MSPPLRPHILVVEDHDPLLKVLCEVLDRAGFEVASASTATQAIDILAGSATLDPSESLQVRSVHSWRGRKLTGLR